MAKDDRSTRWLRRRGPASPTPGGALPTALGSFGVPPFVDHAPDPLLVLVDGRVVWATPGVASCIGWAAHDLVGREFAELCAPLDRAQFDDVLAKVVDGATHRGVFRLRVPSGERLSVLVSLAAAEETGAVVVSVREIDLRVTTEQHLKAERDRAQALLESFMDPYVLLDPLWSTADRVIDFVLVEANEHAAVFTGGTIADVVGRRLCDLVPGFEDAALVDEFAEVLRTGAPLLIDAQRVALGASRDAGFLTVRAVKAGDRLSLTWRDVTPLVGAMDRVRESEQRLRSVLDTMFDPHFTLVPVRDGSSNVVDFEFSGANNAACRAAGLADGELTGRTVLSMFPAHSRAGEAQVALFALALQRGETLVLDDHRVAAWGVEQRFYDLRVVPLGNTLNVSIRDVTERHESARQLAASEERYRLIAHNASDVIIHVRGTTIVWISPSVEVAFGRGPEEWIGNEIEQFVEPDDMELLREGAARVDNGDTVVRRVRVHAPDRPTHWVEMHASRYLDATGRQDGLIASLRIVDTEVHALEELDRLARFDALTGLLNRREALLRIDHLDHPGRRPGGRYAVLFCDLDSFKQINDTHGHVVGDQLLRALSQRIVATVRTDDVVARMGGDEFMLLLSGVHELDQAVSVAEKIRRAVAEPVTTIRGPVHATVSIGVTMASRGESSDALINRADAAMYEAKARGRDQVVAFVTDETPPT